MHSLVVGVEPLNPNPNMHISLTSVTNCVKVGLIGK